MVETYGILLLNFQLAASISLIEMYTWSTESGDNVHVYHLYKANLLTNRQTGREIC